MKVFLIQSEIGHPDPWDDSINMANIGIQPGLTTDNNAYAYENTISFFQRVDNRFSLSHSIYPSAHLVLKRPFSIQDDKTEVLINFDTLGELVEKSKDGIIMLGAPLLDKPLNQQDVIASSSYYHRIDGEIVDLITGEVLKRPKIIPWFFCYKTKDLPLYYIVLNPHSVQCIENVEGSYNNNHVFTIANHLRNLNEIIFKPKLSKNARVIGQNNLLVKGDEFTLEAFGTWFVRRHLPEFFKDVKLKVETNFDYRVEGNKVIVSTLNKERGYISVRWNTGTIMDMTFHASKNRFLQEYIVDIIR